MQATRLGEEVLDLVVNLRPSINKLIEQQPDFLYRVIVPVSRWLRERVLCHVRSLTVNGLDSPAQQAMLCMLLKLTALPSCRLQSIAARHCAALSPLSVVEAISRLPSLTHLDLSGCGIPLHELLLPMQPLRNLTTLNLAGNQLLPEEAPLVCLALKELLDLSNLRALDLSYTSHAHPELIGTHISQGIAALPRLDSLSVAGNRLGPLEIEAIAPLMTQLRSVTLLLYLSLAVSL